MANHNGLIEAIASGAENNPADLDVWNDEILEELASALAVPLPIRTLETLEAWIKKSWVSSDINSLDEKGRARFAEFFLRLGFFAKYKAYGTKYAAPFGYSLFDLENGGGFSVQLHETAKVEAFHVLGVHEKAFILLCSVEEWETHGAEMVRLWDEGRPEDSSLAYRPSAGDVAVITDLSTIHTVTGCILEEFATTSYDAVKRIHDQNEGRAVALPSQHKPVADVLKSAETLNPQRDVKRIGNEWTFTKIPAGNSDITSLPKMGLVGRRVILESSDVHSETVDSAIVSTVFVLGGTTKLVVDGTEFEMNAGDVTALAPSSQYELSSISETSYISICDVSTEFAFADLR